MHVSDIEPQLIVHSEGSTHSHLHSKHVEAEDPDSLGQLDTHVSLTGSVHAQSHERQSTISELPDAEQPSGTQNSPYSSTQVPDSESEL